RRLRRRRDVARERRHPRQRLTARHAGRRIEVEAVAGRPIACEVERYLERAPDTTPELGPRRALDRGHREARGPATENAEGDVAGGKQGAGEAARAGRGEVEGQLQSAARDAGALEPAEQGPHVPAAGLERRIRRALPVAIAREGRRRGDRHAGTVDE